MPYSNLQLFFTNILLKEHFDELCDRSTNLNQLEERK